MFNRQAEIQHELAYKMS